MSFPGHQVELCHVSARPGFQQNQDSEFHKCEVDLLRPALISDLSSLVLAAFRLNRQKPADLSASWRERRAHLVRAGLRTVLPWPCRSPVPDTPPWRTAGPICHHIRFPTPRFSAPPRGPRRRWLRPEDAPVVAGGRDREEARTHLWKSRIHTNTTFQISYVLPLGPGGFRPAMECCEGKKKRPEMIA